MGVTSAQFQAIGPAANGLYADVAGEDDALVNLVNPAKTTPQERQMIADFNRASPTAAPNGNLDMPGWVGADALVIVMKQVIAEHLVGLPAEETHARPGQRLQAALVLTGADDDQGPAQPVAGRDRQVEPLVGNLPGQHKIVVLLLIRGMEPVYIDRRVDHFGRPAIGPLDALGYSL